MVSISEKLKGLKTKVKESIEKEKQIRKEEKEAYEKAKAAEQTSQEQFKKYEDAQKRIKRIEKAREAGIAAAIPGHRKEEVKAAAKKGVLGISTFLKEHIEFVPERKTVRPSKRKMTHKKVKSKRSKRRRY